MDLFFCDLRPVHSNPALDAIRSCKCGLAILLDPQWGAAGVCRPRGAQDVITTSTLQWA